MNLPAFFHSYYSSLVSQEDARVTPDKRANNDYLHVSSLLQGCARAQLIAEFSEKPQLEVAKGADRVVWTMGKAAERHFRNQFIKRVDFAGVVGHWFCRCRAHNYKGLHSKSSLCNICASPADTYEELTLYDHEYKITGNPDMLYIIPGHEKLSILEIKSINKKEFDGLYAPKAVHIHQASAYHRLASSSLVTDPSHMHPDIVTIYVCKDYIFNGSIYKEYHTPATVSTQAIDLVWTEARIIQMGREARVLPPRLPCCTTIQATTAKNCEHCVECFSRSR